VKELRKNLEKLPKKKVLVVGEVAVLWTRCGMASE
jgi:hypothetical protein